MQRLKEFVLVCLVAPVFAAVVLLWETFFEAMLFASVIGSLLLALVPIHVLGYAVLYSRDNTSEASGKFTAACKYMNYSGETVHTTWFDFSSSRDHFSCPPLAKAHT